MVYLGSHIFKGLAREAALKLLELTDGGMIAAYELTLGFRHGPKTIVNDRTLVVIFLSNDAIPARYDRRHARRRSARRHVPAAVLAIAAAGDESPPASSASWFPRWSMRTTSTCSSRSSLPAQIFALRASLARGLSPDNPNVSGTVNRVVQGVRIHAAERDEHGARSFLGVDGGGTKTAVRAGRSATAACVASHEGPTSYHLRGRHRRRRATCWPMGLRRMFARPAIDGSASRTPSSVCPPTARTVRRSRSSSACRSRCSAIDRYRCGNDMICGWAGSLGGADGINIVAGTGSIGYGERRGRTARVGGWGEVFGDEGSAYWIAVQGLNVFTRMSDGRLPRGPLHAVFRASLGSERRPGPVRQGHDMRTIAGASPRISQLVTRAAHDGDIWPSESSTMPRASSRRLSSAVRRALEFEPDEPVPLSYSGGVFNAGALILAPLQRYLKSQGSYEMRPPMLTPDLGAAVYAAKLAAQRPRFPPCDVSRRSPTQCVHPQSRVTASAALSLNLGTLVSFRITHGGSCAENPLAYGCCHPCCFAAPASANSRPRRGTRRRNSLTAPGRKGYSPKPLP